MRRALLIVALGGALASGLGGCVHNVAIPTIQVQKVLVPTPVACDPKIGPAPAFPDTAEALRAAANIYDATKLLLAGRGIRIAWEAEQAAAIKGCSALPRALIQPSR